MVDLSSHSSTAKAAASDRQIQDSSQHGQLEVLDDFEQHSDPQEDSYGGCARHRHRGWAKYSKSWTWSFWQHSGCAGQLARAACSHGISCTSDLRYVNIISGPGLRMLVGRAEAEDRETSWTKRFCAPIRKYYTPFALASQLSLSFLAIHTTLTSCTH